MAKTILRLEDPSHMQPTIDEMAKHKQIKQCTPIDGTTLRVEYDNSPFDDGYGGEAYHDGSTIYSIYHLNVVHALRTRDRDHPIEIAQRSIIRAAVEGPTSDI